MLPRHVPPKNEESCDCTRSFRAYVRLEHFFYKRFYYHPFQKASIFPKIPLIIQPIS